MFATRATTRFVLPIRPNSRRLCPLVALSLPTQPTILPQGARHFSFRRPNAYGDRDPRTGRKWTKSELESMNESLILLGFRTGIPVGRQYKTPPTRQERDAYYRREWFLDLCRVVSCGALAWLYCWATETDVFESPKFTPFTIMSREKVSPTSFIFTVRPNKILANPKSAKTDPYAQQWQKGTWSVEAKQPELQIARSYTPLPPLAGDAIGDLRFLIREEADGEMSRYLARLSVGTKLELRGPHTEFELPKKITDVVFLAGGTGIAPALQIAHTLLQVRNPAKDAPSAMHDQSNLDLPKIHIIWANRRREDCVGGNDISDSQGLEAGGAIVTELRNLQRKYPDNIRVDYLLDEEGEFLDTKIISTITKRPSEVKAHALSSRIDSKLLFVSGPPGFVNFVAGPKRFWSGKEVQGDIGGLLGEVGVRDWKVWKQ